MQEKFLKLREIREYKGFSIKDVSAVLNIRSNYLLDIEEENFDDLPEEVYAVGFIRNYAKFLNSDSDDLVRRFKQSRHVEKIVDSNNVNTDIFFGLKQKFNEWSSRIANSHNTKVVLSFVFTIVLLYVVYLIEER